jgi:hypothetical protein
VIKADWYVAAFLQSLGRMHLRHAFACARKRSLVDQPLVRLEPWDVRISEQGEPRGLERSGKLCAADCVADSLPGQTVHQVELMLTMPAARKAATACSTCANGWRRPICMFLQGREVEGRGQPVDEGCEMVGSED